MPKKSHTPNAKPIRRFGIGLLSILQIIAAILLFFGLNMLSSQHHRPLDLTQELGFTLAPSTIKYLKSNAVQKREKPIRMILAFRADNPLYDRIRPITEEFYRHAKGKIALEIIDPIRANDRAETIAAEYNLVFNQDLVLIDARPDSDDSTVDLEGRKLSAHTNIIGLKDMLVYETDANNQRRVRGFLGEVSLRAGLISAIEGKPRKMMVFADKSDLNSDANTGVWQTFSTNTIAQNILPERVNLSEQSSIPEDVKSVAIIAPRYDITAQEQQILTEYWNRPGSSILVTIGDQPCPPRLRAFLRANGVTPRNDRVLTVKSKLIHTSVVASFTEGLDFMRDFWDKPTLLEGTTRSLEVREGADDLLTRKINPFTLLLSTENYWGETNLTTENPSFDADSEVAGPLPLAAAVVRGAATDDKLAGSTSRLIVFGNTSFLSPKYVRQLNLDFLNSSLNWLIAREDLTGKGPKNLRMYKLPLLPPHVTFVNRVNLVLLPLLLLFIGGMVAATRRA